MRQQLPRNTDTQLIVPLRTPADAGTINCVLRGSDGSQLAALAVDDPTTLQLPAGVQSATKGRTIEAAGVLAFEPGAVVLWPAAGTPQRLTVKAVDGVTNTLYLYERLARPAVQGDKLISLQAFVSVAAALIPNTDENLRADVEYTYKGAVQRQTVYFDVGLQQTPNPATTYDLRRAWPDKDWHMPAEWQNTDGIVAVEEGWRAVWLALRSQGRNPNRIRDVAPLMPATVNRALRHMANGGTVPSAYIDQPFEYVRILDSGFDTLFRTGLGALAWYDADDDGAATPAEERPEPFSVKLQR